MEYICLGVYIDGVQSDQKEYKQVMSVKVSVFCKNNAQRYLNIFNKYFVAN